VPVRSGTLLLMQRDWSASESAPKPRTVPSKPDHTFHSMWVRVFPLVSVPLGDPYPETVDYNKISLTNSSGLKVFTLDAEALMASGKSIQFDFGAGTIAVDKNSYPLIPVWIAGDGADITELRWDKGLKQPDGKSAEVRARLRGGFTVKKTLHQPPNEPVSRELWSVINVLPVDDYIRSVVPSEVISNWLTETIKAQAIAARTYGMYELATSRAQGQDFDADPSTWYQSYQGVQFWDRDKSTWRDVEHLPTSAAVDATKGQVIIHGTEVIKAYFSANSGGRTCLASECLEMPSNPAYIQEVDDHPLVRAEPGGSWGTKATLTPDAILGVLQAQGIDPRSSVTRLEPLEKGPSGRTWRLRVQLANGSSLDLNRPVTRKIMHLFGPIRSFLYDLQGVDVSGKQAISGYGYGHAVGMSQWGAQLFAKAGWDSHKILEYYYNQVSIVDLVTH
jgi:SpoIID/LytB domain protein